MSQVFFVSSRVLKNKGILQKFTELLEMINPPFIQKENNILIKTHFGEDGNTAYINPLYIRKTVDFIRKKEAYPFIGDTNTLYSGRRKNGVTHLDLAIEHGFSYASMNAPVVILDGLKSNNVKDIPVNLQHFKSVQLGGEFFSADGMIVITHVKGHLIAGMGAAIKNLSMGLGSRTQKQRMHGDIKPEYVQKKCIYCGLCAKVCPESAITVNKPDFNLNRDLCVGCAECITHCPTQALKILWNEKPALLAEKMAETAFVAINHLPGKILFFNFLINITPDCDCMSWSDNALINDIGVLASYDPVAIDQASYDLISQQKILNNSVLEDKDGDIFTLLRPGIDPLRQLEYAESLGLGSRKYDAVDLKW
ncbi:MAG: DUF362 domain-containing protein [Candidatus Cloacimonetes bacterium]|nr:DUF362 domain-containing protein [Candidatus Cloacimonadota bacterium]